MTESSQQDQRQGKAEGSEPYEPPTIEPLGTMVELTEGFGFFVLDLSGLQPSSDRALKENFGEVDSEEILTGVERLPLESWNYIAEGAGVRHIGPMAQDFAASFGVGADETSIAAVDAIGVCLASIQALSARLDERDGQIAALRAELEELRGRAAVTA